MFQEGYSREVLKRVPLVVHSCSRSRFLSLRNSHTKEPGLIPTLTFSKTLVKTYFLMEVMGAGRGSQGVEFMLGIYETLNWMP